MNRPVRFKPIEEDPLFPTALAAAESLLEAGEQLFRPRVNGVGRFRFTVKKQEETELVRTCYIDVNERGVATRRIKVRQSRGC